MELILILILVVFVLVFWPRIGVGVIAAYLGVAAKDREKQKKEEKYLDTLTLIVWNGFRFLSSLC